MDSSTLQDLSQQCFQMLETLDRLKNLQKQMGENIQSMSINLEKLKEEEDKEDKKEQEKAAIVVTKNKLTNFSFSLSTGKFRFKNSNQASIHFLEMVLFHTFSPKQTPFNGVCKVDDALNFQISGICFNFGHRKRKRLRQIHFHGQRQWPWQSISPLLHERLLSGTSKTLGGVKFNSTHNGPGLTSSVVLRSERLSDLIAQLQELLKGVNESEISPNKYDTVVLATQIRQLAQEIRELAVLRPVTIFNGNSSTNGGYSSYLALVTALGAMGYCYMWWKRIILLAFFAVIEVREAYELGNRKLLGYSFKSIKYLLYVPQEYQPHAAELQLVQIEPIPSGNLPPGFDSPACRSVYVGNIHVNVTEKLLAEVFQTVIPLAGCKLIRKDKSSFGFVDYIERTSAALAIMNLHGRQLYGQALKVNWAYTSNQREDTSGHFNVFVGDLSPQVTDATLFACFSVYPNCLDARVMWDHKTGRSKGYGFVSFHNQQDAQGAINELTGKWLGNRQIRCNWATKGAGANEDKHIDDSQNTVVLTSGSSDVGQENTNEETPENNPAYTTVYVGNLSHEMTQAELHCQFQVLGAGVIEEVRVQRDKGFGFVRYNTHEEAASAIQLANGRIICGKPMKCSWCSKPTLHYYISTFNTFLNLVQVGD